MRAIAAGRVRRAAARAATIAQRSRRVVALPVPRPLTSSGNVTQAAIDASLPEAVGEFVRWLVQDSGWTVPTSAAPAATPRRAGRSGAGDVCLLFRRFLDFRTDVTRDYVEALESRGVPHLLVGGQAFHEREEVDALRTALTAIEWPDDGLSVFATLRGPFFAVAEEELLAWHARYRGFRPFDVARATLPARARRRGRGAGLLRDLNRQRNHRPVAETVSRLIEVDPRARRLRAVARRRAGARQRAAHRRAGAPLRGRRRPVVPRLRRRAARRRRSRADARGADPRGGHRRRAPDDGAQGQGPGVPGGDPGRHRLQAQSRRRAALPRLERAAWRPSRLAGWTPLDLREHNALEASRDAAEGVRLAYVAATRARDCWSSPAVGDASARQGLGAAAVAGDLRRRRDRPAAGVPRVPRPGHRPRPPAEHNAPTLAHDAARAPTASRDPDHRAAPTRWCGGIRCCSTGAGAERRGLRNEHLIGKDAPAEVVAADRAGYDAWRQWRDDTIARRSAPSLQVMTATEWAHATVDGTRDFARRQSRDRRATVRVVDAGVFDPHRPTGAALRHPGARAARARAARRHDRAGRAPGGGAGPAAARQRRRAGRRGRRWSTAPCEHALLDGARAALAAGRACRREVALGVVVDEARRRRAGRPALRRRRRAGWSWTSRPTSRSPAAKPVYQRQVALYMDAAQRVTGATVEGALLRV